MRPSEAIEGLVLFVSSQPFCFGHHGFKWVTSDHNLLNTPLMGRVYKSRGSLIIETEFNFISGCVSLRASVGAGTLLVAGQTCRQGINNYIHDPNICLSASHFSVRS